MKKFLFILLLSVIALSSCSGEEKELPLLFSTENISDPENITIDYYTPDPSCLPKMYWIKANNCASEITIKCTNANSIFIENSNGAISEEFSWSEAQWKAVVINSNTITISLEELYNRSEEAPAIISAGFNVVSQTKQGDLNTSINVIRYTKGFPTH